MRKGTTMRQMGKVPMPREFRLKQKDMHQTAKAVIQQREAAIPMRKVIVPWSIAVIPMLKVTAQQSMEAIPMRKVTAQQSMEAILMRKESIRLPPVVILMPRDIPLLQKGTGPMPRGIPLRPGHLILMRKVYYTDTKSTAGAHIMGIYGDADTPYSWFLGGGTSSTRALAAKILYTGDAYIRNAWHAGGTGYAEMYRTLCGQAIEPGYFVTLEGECIRIANDTDTFILGVTSALAGFVANSSELNQGNSYLTSAWNEILYEDVLLPEKTDKDGNIIEPLQVVKQPVLRMQSAVSSQAATYSSGSAGNLVTLLGQVLVLDDGTCVVNGYCQPNKDGIATASAQGYKVMKRISDNQILIFFR